MGHTDDGSDVLGKVVFLAIKVRLTLFAEPNVAGVRAAISFEVFAVRTPEVLSDTRCSAALAAVMIHPIIVAGGRGHRAAGAKVVEGGLDVEDGRLTWVKGVPIRKANRSRYKERIVDHRRRRIWQSHMIDVAIGNPDVVNDIFLKGVCQWLLVGL